MHCSISPHTKPTEKSIKFNSLMTHPHTLEDVDVAHPLEDVDVACKAGSSSNSERAFMFLKMTKTVKVE